MDIVEKLNQKPIFLKKQRVPPISVYILNGAQIRLRKRQDQALISISTILQFSAMVTY